MYKKQHIHFVGIGGIGMSGLAQVLIELGYTVSGSDIRETRITRTLSLLGAIIYRGHTAGHIKGADLVVQSSAVKDDNPEIVAARKSDLPVIPRAQMLAELMRLKKFGVAVAGAHGKTSTTTMVSTVLDAGGLDPTVVIGGKINGLGKNAYWGNGELLVAEADESDGSFLRLTPTIGVITNIDREHLDYYVDIDTIIRTFSDFLGNIPFYGLAILCRDDPYLARMLRRLTKRVVTYGTAAESDLQARGISFEGRSTQYVACLNGLELGEIRLSVPGLHHVRNSLAALAVGLELGIPFDDIRRGLAMYRGVGRRFEILGEKESITLVDDYAHHPTEIRATLSAARSCWPERRLVVLFEPHRYSRTQALMEEFKTAFALADEIWIAEIYPASEEPVVGVSAERLARNIAGASACRVNFAGACGALPEKVVPHLQPGDVVMTLGAGSIGRIGREIISLLETKESAVA